MAHPTPQTPAELTRECLGCIWHVADDLAREAEAGNVAGVRTQFAFLKTQMARLDTIEKTVRQAPRTL